jgi:hypothetical protein
MLAELDFEVSLDDTDSVSYCHILCCHPSLTLCGAYKPILCRMLVVATEGIPTECDVCRRLICPDCINLAFKPCPRCV